MRSESPSRLRATVSMDSSFERWDREADVVVVGCSNCRDQIMRRIPKFYPDCAYEVKYIWQLVAEAYGASVPIGGGTVHGGTLGGAGWRAGGDWRARR